MYPRDPTYLSGSRGACKDSLFFRIASTIVRPGVAGPHVQLVLEYFEP